MNISSDIAKALALPTVETLLIQAKTLLDDARVAAEGGHPVTHDLQRQAREVIGAALDHCAPVSP